MIIKLATFLLFTLIFTSFFGNVKAVQEASSGTNLVVISVRDVTYEQVNPSDGSKYLIKRIGEKINMFFSFSSKSKVKVYKKLVNVRLAELKFIIEKKEMGYFEAATKRYFTTVGQLKNLLVSSNIKSEFMPIKEELSSHISVLIKLRDSYDPSTAEWRFVEDDINYVKGYLDELSTE
ncbi:hypothetical protein A3F00_02930 [Candidatus Daviesbacteria bacterium RIFCSPHIGHO2_12_FULL_37_11]|uniref:DUF5667 domain-containing protein n=1 Tax=Candidatus Daviesbacteria bacterium RIFCSPHIGHO2_12_FULL_37_11 TaxID=1797777 RepID=A0A1F5KBR1_9BACT|nr:MAG: hypothetical protein A2769_04220 [Candidatus Daviesbacteria bacterium RIFCSPHIGHO2_01_FULL_37_27]OGE38254.1 MAG: hypothetical protein A3F00_02930 [Candidatus Daviesbacteria bacterium RIFCSPHIGHO2_12_FULL_37_11]